MDKRLGFFGITVVLALGLGACNRNAKNDPTATDTAPAAGVQHSNAENSTGGVAGQGDTRGTLNEGGMEPAPSPSPSAQ